MRRVLRLLSLIVLISIFIYSCSEYSGYEQTESGVYYKFHKKNDNVKLKPGDEVSFHLQYSINDSVIYDTKDSPYANKQVILESECPGDIYEVLTLMSVGDSATFILEADSFYLVTARYKKLPPNLTPGSKLRAEVKILTLKTKEELELEKRRQLAEMKAKEPEIIAELKKNRKADKEFIKNAGIFYKPIKNGSGSLPKATDFITVEYIIRDRHNNVMFRSDRLKDKMAFECMGDNFETKGFNLIISKMKKGQKATFIVPSDLAFGEEGAARRIPPYSPLVYTIEILNIQSKESFLAKKRNRDKEFIKGEQQLLSKYINENNITIEARESGLYYIEKLEGSGDYVKPGDKVKVHYTLYNLLGGKIDSSIDRGEAFTFVVGKREVIAGWDEALPLMKPGGKATLIIPSKLAYKDKKRNAQILPYTPLRFEIELLEIIK